MTVYTHPKDQGPIDTASREVCDNCSTVLRRKADRVYLDSVRKSDRHKQRTHLQVCPSCKEPTDHYHAEVIKHLGCKAVFTEINAKILDSSSRPHTLACPSCNEELTEDNIRVFGE